LATLPGASPYPSGTLSNDSNGGAAASQNQGSALAALPVASPSPSVTPSIFPGEAEVVDTGVVGGATPSTYEVFIKMDGITGESTKGGHEGWIELESYNYEVTGPVPIDSLHMGEVGFGDLVIMKQLDKSSPKLYEACCNGKHFPEVILEVCESGGTRNVFMRYVLKDVICKHIDSSSPKIFKEWGSASPQIFSIAPSGDMVEPESRPIESISLNFSKIQWEYITSDGQTVTAGWDTVENKGL
jgi:type VI secretion system secreted protein Hcp